MLRTLTRSLREMSESRLSAEDGEGEVGIETSECG